MNATFATELPADCLDAARRGERSAQSTIYRQYERPVYNLIRRMCNDPDLAQDLMQETFLRAFKTIHQFRGDAPFGAWLRAIAATEALMHLRKQRRSTEIFAFGSDDEGSGFEDVSTIDLERSLELLPSLPRSVLWLYHVEGYTHVEIAEMAGKTVSFSKSQLARAHQKLRVLLRVDGAAGAVLEEKMPCSDSLPVSPTLETP